MSDEEMASLDPIAKRGQTTLLDVARHCGVSRATVSLVLRDSPKVTRATHERVRVAMAELGYIYNRSAAHLRSGVSRTIGLIIPNITNLFFAGLTAGMTQALDDKEQVALIGITFDDRVRQQKLLKRMQESSVDGIVICPAPGTAARDLDFGGADAPALVQILRKVTAYKGDYVSTDYVEVITQAVDHLVSRGSRRLAYLGSVNDHSAQHDRYAAFMAACHRYGLSDAVTARAPVSLQGGYEGTLALLRAPQRPDAIVYYSDVGAFGGLRAFRELGIEAGRDVAVVGCDDLDGAEFCDPKLTSFRLNAQLIGAKGVEMLRLRIHKRAKPAESVLFAPELIIRQSSPPRADGAGPR